MSLGLVSPILNRGVRSRWVSTLPAGSKMLTIDAAGDVSYTDIPTAAWGSITGTLSSQTDLQNALNAKLSLTGGTVTGQLTNALGTITASTPLTLTQTWNNAAVTFTGLKVDITNTASLWGGSVATSSKLFDFQQNGSSRVYAINKYDSVVGGAALFVGSAFMGEANGGHACFGISNVSGNQFVWLNNAGLVIPASRYLGWGSTDEGMRGPISTWADLRIFRDAAQTLAQRNSTNAQTFRVYNTYTDANNYEHLQVGWSGNVARIGTVATGTGSVRQIEIVQLNGAGAKQNYVYQFDFSTAGTGGRFNINSASDVRYLTISGRPDQAKIEFNTNIADCFFGSGSDPIGDSARNGIRFYNAARGGGATLITSTGISTILRFGGLTSSFPAIKRNGTAINFRLADDSADAGITASTATFSGNVTVSAVNIVTDTTTGTKIGTATTQKIGFYNATPVVQPAAVADATDAASVITQLNLLLSRMRDLGLIAT